MDLQMTRKSFSLNRRHLLTGAAALAFTGAAGIARAAPSAAVATSLPLSDVRLLPSPYKAAVDANLAYLMYLSPDRFLHNYHKFAGLPVRGELYGGWEGDTIAGEGLGHYLSALALMHAQTGDAECKQRITYIVSEMARVQARQGDGYCAGFLRKRKDGTIVDGKEIFPEIVAGDIRSYGFDLNGAWSPLYNLHKVFAGLLDAHALAGNQQALTVAIGFGGYMDKVFGALTPEQVQSVLNCEYGGLNESFAELYARTNDPRWLKLSQTIYDHKVLDAVVAGRDELSNIHSNTQIPKVIGLARISELTDKPEFAKGAGFFWRTIVDHHSFVIGGNGDREYFFQPDTLSQHITEQTCEECASYNMLKLTRHLYSWQPDAAYFDYYERTHLNHILAAQDPKSGMFTYMTPLMSGSARGFSSKDNDFWCCVLSGMESHAKHGDSIYWQGKDASGGDALFVNLFIPSTVAWAKKKAAFELNTQYPYDGRIAFTVKRGGGAFTLGLRIPAWAKTYAVNVNGAPAGAKTGGYVLIKRQWRAGDVVTLDLSLDLRLESTPGDDKVVALLRGPMVLAADLAPAGEEPYEADAPALVGADLLAGFKPVSVEKAIYRTDGTGRPGDMTFSPFYNQYERRSAVYFSRYTDAEWATAQVAYKAEQARRKDEAARSVDVMHLGEMQAEHDHNLQSELSYPVVYRARNGRDARNGGYFSFEFKVQRDGKDAGPLVLQATYWGSETNRVFDILVDGTAIAHERLSGRQPGAWIDVDYPVPEALTKGKQKITVRFDPKEGKTAGPVFGVRLFTAAASAKPV
jgi:DUF1680 family protein